MALALLSQARTARLRRESGEVSARAAYFVEQVRAGGETVRGLGMRASAWREPGASATPPWPRRWRHRIAPFAATSRAFPVPAIDDAGFGAWLAIRGEVTRGS